jgi:hypothetical protein
MTWSGMSRVPEELRISPPLLATRSSRYTSRRACTFAVTFICRRNIAYVVFISLLVPFGMLVGSGPTRCRFRWRDHGRDNPVERGVTALLHSRRVGDRLYRQRPVGNEALDRRALSIVCTFLPLLLEPFFVRRALIWG